MRLVGTNLGPLCCQVGPPFDSCVLFLCGNLAVRLQYMCNVWPGRSDIEVLYLQSVSRNELNLVRIKGTTRLTLVAPLSLVLLRDNLLEPFVPF